MITLSTAGRGADTSRQTACDLPGGGTVAWAGTRARRGGVNFIASRGGLNYPRQQNQPREFS